MHAAPGPLRRFLDRARARRDGKRDGVLGIPTLDEVAHPPALMAIAQRADEALAELARGWAADEARLRSRFGATERELGNAREDVELAAHDIAEAERRRETQKHRTDVLVAQPQQPSGPRISMRVYVPAIVLILLAEFPLNAIAFRLFGEAEVLTWVMTAGLAIMLVLCAHGLGTFLRMPHRGPVERRWVWVLIGLPVLTIVAIAVIRARYLSLEAMLTGFDALGPVAGSLAFGVINLLIYTGATMLSYLAHGPQPSRAVREAEEARDRERRAVGDARRELTDAKRTVRAREEALGNAEVAADEALRQARARASELVAYHRGLMSSYCAANLRARSLPETPPILRELPELHVPAELLVGEAKLTVVA
ncbi:MAG: hypothetical protein U0V56_11855 [Actinomycetota bacterium]